MAVVARFNLTSGLHTGIGQAGQSHAMESINFFSDQGRTRKRGGMTCVRNVTGPKTQIAVGFGEGTSDPSAVDTSAASGTTTSTNVYIGAEAQFNSVSVAGTVIDSDGTFRGTSVRDLTVEYWNGASWSTLNVAWRFLPSYNRTQDCAVIAPMVAFGDGSNPASMSASDVITYSFAPPEDWATKTISGTPRYFTRIRGYEAGTFTAAASIAADTGSSWAHATENRILHINTWRGRDGSRNEFIAYRYGDDGSEIRFMLNGTVLTPSDTLAPNSTSKLFHDGTKMLSIYYPASDRLIGYISGHTWFYVIPGTNEIYTLEADPTGTDTAYASIPLGLSAAMPPATHIALFDGRIFALNGDVLRWSAPAPYADFWPNGNELFLDDGKGPGNGLLVFGGALVLFKGNAVYNVLSDGSAEFYEAIPLNGGKGGVGGGTACGNFGVWMAKDGIYKYDGTDTEKLSSAIDEMFRTQMGMRLGQAVAVFHEPFNQYRVFYPGDDPNILDKALYVDLSGYEAGEDQQELAIWPQGKYEEDDYGFQATCVHEDTTVSPPRTLVGDRYGNVWELDSGLYEAGPVKAKIVGAPVNVGKSSGVNLTSVNVTLMNHGDVDIAVKVIPETLESYATTQTVSPYKEASDELFNDDDMFNDDDYFSDEKRVVTMEVEQDVNVRNFSVAVTSETAGEVELVAFEVEANASGRRRER